VRGVLRSSAPYHVPALAVLLLRLALVLLDQALVHTPLRKAREAARGETPPPRKAKTYCEKENLAADGALAGVDVAYEDDVDVLAARARAA
jgi:hypothetical protein